jgi:Ca2+-binding RTX toxin-like protein
MTLFIFPAITAAQALAIGADDQVIFPAGAARDVAAIFNPDGRTITVTFHGHEVIFGPGLIDAAAAEGLKVGDGVLLIGGKGADELVGRAADDALFGGEGDDILLAHGGHNLVQGNQGDDRVLADEGADVIFGGQGDDVLVTGIGGALRSEAGDFANGNRGNDTVIGGAGSDSLHGGQGADSIHGGAGDDFLSGDRGDDTVTGGSGSDVFHGSQDAGLDRILDFNQAEGDRVMLDPGTTFTLNQVGADTVVDMGLEHRIVLVGVQLSSLTPGWIV